MSSGWTEATPTATATAITTATVAPTIYNICDAYQQPQKHDYHDFLIMSNVIRNVVIHL
jgi:hypothetical protein